MDNLFDLWDFGDAVASETRFREAVDSAHNDEDRALAMTQVARAQGLQGDFEGARETLANADRLLLNESIARAQYWVEIGRVENTSGNPNGALPHFAKSLAMASALQAEYLTIDAAHMLAIAAPLEEQPMYGEQALRLARAARDERAKRWVGPIVNNLGWTYMDLKQPKQALPYFKESVEFRISQGAEAPIRMARYSLGCVLRAAGDVDEALAELRIAEAMGGSIGFIEEEIGECLCDLNRHEEAKTYFAEAHRLLSSNTDLATTEPERIERLKNRS